MFRLLLPRAWGLRTIRGKTSRFSEMPVRMMTIEGSHVGTLGDLREFLALVRAGKVPPTPLETRPADQAGAALSDLKSGGRVRGRVVLHH